MIAKIARFSKDVKDLRKLWPYLRQDKSLLLVAAILIPVISTIQMLIPLLLKWVIDSGIMAEDTKILVYGSAFYFCLLIAEYVTRGSQSYLAAMAVHRMILHLRRGLIRHILKLRPAYHDHSMSGILVTRTTSDFDNLSESLNQGVLTAVVDIAVLIGTITGLYILDWRLALATTCLFPLVVAIIFYFSAALKKAMIKARKRIAELNAFSQECLYGSSTIKILASEQHADQRFHQMAIKYRNSQMTSVVLDAGMFSLLEGVSAITMGVVLYFSLTQLEIATDLSVGVLVAFVQYIQDLFQPIKQLSNKIAMLQGAFTSMDRIFKLFDVQEFIGGKKELASIDGHIQFDNINFGYSHDQQILKNISFKVPSGTSTALVGPTGSGKSSIIKLLSKLYDGYEGNIFLDGQNIVDLNGQKLRQKIAIVPQDIVLFDGSIEFNITLGDPDVTIDQARKAAKLVGADNFINALSGGYSFQVAEQGKNLSHGQRQLLVFARAVAKNPHLIVLDEATSAVDPQSEAIIQNGIASLMTNRTVVVIAHRLSTIEKCDQIIYLQNGSIVERGTHTQLMGKKGAYFQLQTAAAVAERATH